MTIKDLHPENTVLRRKKCPFIEISWTCYFHLHLGRIIRPNLQWSRSPVNHECSEEKRNAKNWTGLFRKVLWHINLRLSYILQKFPDAIFRRRNVFHEDVFFDGPSGEEKWILCKSTILEFHVPASKVKSWRVRRYKNDDTVYCWGVTAESRNINVE